MPGKRLPKPQFLGGLALWGLIALVLWSTRHLPLEAEGAPGPRFMPLLLAGALALLTLAYWWNAWQGGRTEASLPGLRQLGRPAVFVALTILLILGWERLGALPTVLVCAFLELRLLEGYGWGRAALVSLVLGGVTVFLFQVVLGVSLPGGIFESLSYIRL